MIASQMRANDAAPREFDYGELTSRNLGFVDERQQRVLREARVFVCGVGGMGGACVQSLVRAGIGHLGIADFDRFELSNLNRQVFSDLDAVGREKIAVTAERVLRINPTLELETWGRDWTDELETILGAYPLVVNAMDDVRASILLYREAGARGATVIDAYTSPLPSVTVVKPEDPRPEERLGFPTAGKAWHTITDAMIVECLHAELAFVLAHTSSIRHVLVDRALEIAAGRAPRMSFAPMVEVAGSLMSYEVICEVLDAHRATDCRGYFFNPYDNRVERPARGLFGKLREQLARRRLARILDGAQSS